MITYILAIIPGWVCGAVVNYLADVLPLRRKLTKPFCIQCDLSQNWINYFFWPRKCPNCSHKRNARTWITEVFYIVAAVFMSLHPPMHLGFWLGMVVLAFFGVIVLVDLEYRLILHPVSLAGAGLGFIVGVIQVGWWKSLLGGVAGFGIMWLIYQLGVLIIKVINRRRGQIVDDVALGFGDVNLSGVLGLMLGWPVILVGLVLAVVIGGVVSLIYILIKLITRKYQAFMALPYGPFLVTGAVLLIYFREQILALLGG